MKTRRALVWGLLAVGLLLAGLGVYFYLSVTGLSRQWEQVQVALENHDLPAAIEHLQKYLEARPGGAEAHFLLARTQRRAGQYEPARHHLGEASRLGWDSKAIRAEATLAEIQATSVRTLPGRDLGALVAGPAPDRGFLEALYRGDLAAHNWDRAGLWLHLWLEAYPDEWAPRLWQAELLERFGKYDRARADYLRVLELRPEHLRPLLGVGLIAVASRGDYAEAESYLTRYLARVPGHPEATLGLARARYARGDTSGARTLARHILDEHPDHARAALLLGTIEAEAEHDDEALRLLRLGESADRQAASYQLAQVLRRVGKSAEAEKYLRTFEELRGLNRDLETATRAADRDPKNADLQYEVGRLNRAIGEEDFAAQWFQQALKLNPEHAASHIALAEYYSHQSDPESARRAELHRRAAHPQR
jgi:tetratricopeptide (TPR) repeat protein